LVWDAIEPLRPAIDARVFAYIASREFSRADFPQTGARTFRLDRAIIGDMLARVSLPQRAVSDAADFMLQLVERHSPRSGRGQAGGKRRLFRPDKRQSPANRSHVNSSHVIDHM
jgi:hypothetical protein